MSKNSEGTIGGSKKFSEKSTTPKKIEREDPLFSSGFVGYLKEVQKRKRGPFTLNFHWPEMALVVSVKWTFQCEVCGKKKGYCKNRIN